MEPTTTSTTTPTPPRGHVHSNPKHAPIAVSLSDHGNPHHAPLGVRLSDYTAQHHAPIRVHGAPNHAPIGVRLSNPHRGRSPSRRLASFTSDDRQRSRSRNYDIFLPKTSHLHTPKRPGTCANPDKITRLASPTRCVSVQSTDSVGQHYRTSLSAVSQSRDELHNSSLSSENLDSSSDAISCRCDPRD